MSDYPIDSEMLAELRSLNEPGEDAAGEIIDIFLSTAPGQLASLRTAVSDGDTATAGAMAHKLKGGAGTFGAERFSALCLAIEMGARAGVIEGGVAAVDAVDAEYERVREALEREKLL